VQDLKNSKFVNILVVNVVDVLTQFIQNSIFAESAFVNSLIKAKSQV